MARLVATLLIAGLLLGSVGLCQWHLTRRVEFRMSRDVHEEDIHLDDGNHTFDVVLTPAFSAIDDPFAVRVDNSAAPRLVVKYAEGTVFLHTEDVRTGEKVTIRDVSFGGDRVSLYVEGNPSSEDAARPCALRVQILRDGVVCDDQTIWSEGGGTKPAGSLDMSLEPRLRTLDRGLGETKP